MAQRTTLSEFEAVFPKLQEALLNQAKQYKLPDQELKWYKTVTWLLRLVVGDSDG